MKEVRGRYTFRGVILLYALFNACVLLWGFAPMLPRVTPLIASYLELFSAGHIFRQVVLVVGAVSPSLSDQECNASD